MNRMRLDGGDALVFLVALWLGLELLFTHLRETRCPIETSTTFLKGD